MTCVRRLKTTMCDVLEACPGGGVAQPKAGPGEGWGLRQADKADFVCE